FENLSAMHTTLRLRSTRGATVKCDSLSACPIGRRARQVDEHQQRGEPLRARESVHLGVERASKWSNSSSESAVQLTKSPKLRTVPSTLTWLRRGFVTGSKCGH